jgi:tRNA threonylcarbamoyladenosine biosynthesis protein TsaB
MALILAIDTSTKVCSIALHQDGFEIGHQAYHLQKSHSSLLPVVIKQLLENVDLAFANIDAVAVSAGPGSYTGLRIGTSTAKGLCFGLNVPLISFDSLDSMFAVVKDIVTPDTLICPMIDARRMEVFCNLRAANGSLIWASQPLILEPNSFDAFDDSPLLLIGDGAEKCKDFFAHKANIRFQSEIFPNAFSVGKMLEAKFENQQFEDLAYFEPEYLKEYRTNTPKQKLNT